MRKAIIFVAAGLILIGLAGVVIFPNVRTDIIQMIPFLRSVPQKVTLTYWGLWEPREVIQPLLDEYQKENTNVTIEYEQRDPTEYAQMISTRFGVEGGPDIVRIHDTWIPWLKNRIAPIPSSVMTTEDYESTFYAVNKIFGKIGNQYYAIPLMVDGLALVYNKNLFDAAGITTPPADWNEFRTDAKLLTKRDSSGNIVQSGAALGYADNIDYFADILGLMFAQNGVQFVDKDGKVTFNNSISQVGGNLGVEALRFYTLFGSLEQSWDPNWSNSTQEFAKGRVAMVFIPSHRLLEVSKYKPTFNIEVAAVPQLPVTNSTVGKVNWANYWVETVSQKSSNSKEAWKFLKWMSEKEQLTTFYRLASNVRLFGEPYPRTDMGSILNADKYTATYTQEATTYTTWYFASGVTNVTLNDPIITSLKKLVNNSVGSNDPTSELSKTASEIQAILNNAIK